MSSGKIDFLELGKQTFQDSSKFTDHIQYRVDVDEIEGQLSIVGSVSNFDSRAQFKRSLSEHFEIVRDLEEVILVSSKSNGVPYYIHLNDGCPLFITTGTKTEDIPNTLGAYIKGESDLSRMWVGKKQMEEIRQNIAGSQDVGEDEDILIPYFTAHYSPNSDVENVTREGFERTIQYYGDDGLHAFKEMRDKYGVYPTNVQFEKPGEFKFRITQDGVFTINKGSAEPALNHIQNAIDHLRKVKKAINSGGYGTVDSGFGSHPQSTPWKIKLNRSLQSPDVQYLDQTLESNDWDFGVLELSTSTGDRVGFNGELVDNINYGTVGIRTKDDQTIRVFPREETGFGQSIRLYSFISNSIDKNSFAEEA